MGSTLPFSALQIHPLTTTPLSHSHSLPLPSLRASVSHLPPPTLVSCILHPLIKTPNCPFSPSSPSQYVFHCLLRASDWLVEHRAMALELVSPKPHLFPETEPPAATSISLSAPNAAEQQCRNNNITDTRDLDTFASIFSLIQTSKESHAIQPLRATSSLPTSLTKMSLELCTENLGCETGTDLTNTHFSSHSSSSSNPSGTEPSKPRERAKLQRSLTHRKENPGPLPPPLTSISGQSSIQMRPHREGGRLILKAVTVPSCAHRCLQAERSDGRLRLWLVGRNSLTEAAEDGEEYNKVGEDRGCCNINSSRGVCLEERRRRRRNMANEKDENMGNEKDERGEIGIGNYQRPGRCKEGGGHRNKGLLNWKRFLVASS